MPTKTLKVRIKDKHRTALCKKASSVNFVWNYLNELSYRSINERGQFLSSYDLQHYTKGANKELGLHSQTLQMIGAEYATRRKQFKKNRLKWRSSRGSKRSLGWIPLNGQSLKWRNGQLFHDGSLYGVFDSYGLSSYKFRSGSFNEDARGRWYFNVVVDVEVKTSTSKSSVGVDLGLKDIATSSGGEKLESGRWYRDLEDKLGKARRAGNRRRVKAIHAKIANRRKDALHKFSRKLVDRNAAIIVGDVASLKLAKTKMAKSVLDAGWGMLKTQLEYKCAHAGCVFLVVDEANTTQTCSSCGAKPDSRPKGITGLGIREWTCDECGATHDRDINAAKNILALGHERLAGEKVAA